ncbi:MAG: 4-(cytidine 5'-diphospho)-2-C-methyl-D-erythritol kinase [Bacteroidetes bacterium SW_9_63_38]|nr:MAG: 4-(cytidine 5'-diphospho)-2-C-methyl-D-erythritol kinase [Bacteroidetes bacterium SW_9_63_38]
MSLVERAPAKINLGLHVLRKRPDGFHDVETVLHRIDWADTVTAQPAGTLSMTCSDSALPTDEDNLCMQAARRLAAAFDVAAGAELHLEKRVPYGAGLGGGSSDAAATLRLLARLWDLDASDEQLHRIAAEIGADVPFFLSEAPAAYATGRGDELTVLHDDGEPYRLPFSVVVAVPPIEVATPDAYARVTPDDADRPCLPSVVRANNPPLWREALVNDFEPPIAAAHPEVERVRDRLCESRADYVSLSGSGGAVCGLFADDADAEVLLDADATGEARLHLTSAPDPDGKS